MLLKASLVEGKINMLQYLKKSKYLFSYWILTLFMINATAAYPNTLEDVVAKVNQTLPKSYLGTRLERMHLEGDIVELYITVTDTFGLQTQQYDWFNKTTEIADWMISCMQPFYLQFLNNGISVKRLRQSEVSNLKFNTVINPSDCTYFKDANNEKLITKYLKQQNSILPVMVDSETELVHYKQKFGDTIEVTYKMINLDVNNIDIDLFSNKMTGYLMPNVCNASDFSVLLKRNVRFVLRYIDRSGTPFFKLPFNLDDC